MATKQSRALHIPRLSPPGVVGRRAPRVRRAAAAPVPGPWPHAASALGLPATAFRGWRRRALREGVVVSLLTSLLTSAVLAAPEVFQQSPAVSWGQFTTSTAVLDQSTKGGVLLDCL
ncbi:MAG: hypothetical protein FJ083_11005 [Cyanobacteria bacterium K_Offshore_surface_m2_239]|nr:hypothetical protein [Cyanobacteria bacterium K_Offshore_surface_m2_239]